MYFLFSTLLSFLLIFVGMAVFRKMKILDKPWADVAARKPVPTIIWVFVFLAFLINIFVFYTEYFQNRIFLWLLAGSLIVIIFSLRDELNYIGKIKMSVPPSVRLLSHVLACIVALWVWWINIEQITVAWHVFHLPVRLFSIFFLVRSLVCINAINRFDGINAQASWVSSIWFIAIFLIVRFVVLPQFPNIPSNELYVLDMIQNLSLVFFGLSALSTFIEYKPLWLVRDVGVMFFWFAIAYLSIIWWAKIWTLLVALSLVIFDSVRVLINRVFFMRKSALKWDYTHLHYRLIGLWWTRSEARATIRIRSIVMMILMLIQWSNWMNKLIIFLLMAMIFFWVNGYLFRYKKLPCGLKKEKNT